MFKKIFLAGILLLAGAAIAGPPPVNSIHNKNVAACAEKEDAQEVVTLAETDASKGLSLLIVKVLEGKCAAYEGIFVINEVVGHYGPIWVLRVTTMKNGILFVIYGEEERGRWSI